MCSNRCQSFFEMEKSSPQPSYGDMQERPPDDRTSSVDPEKMHARLPASRETASLARWSVDSQNCVGQKLQLCALCAPPPYALLFFFWSCLQQQASLHEGVQPDDDAVVVERISWR